MRWFSRVAVLKILLPVNLLQMVKSLRSLHHHCTMKLQHIQLAVTVVQARHLCMVRQLLGLFIHWQWITPISASSSRVVWKVHWQLMVQHYWRELPSLWQLQILVTKIVRLTCKWIQHQHHLMTVIHLDGRRMLRK